MYVTLTLVTTAAHAIDLQVMCDTCVGGGARLVDQGLQAVAASSVFSHV